MGEVISMTAKVSRAAEHIREAYATGISRGGEIAAAAEARLGSSVTAINNAEAMLDAANEAEAGAWVAVDAADKLADPTIGGTRDDMWNVLGRPQQSPAMDEVYPGGVTTYTKGDPREQPLLMKVLHARILASSAPQWTDPKCQAWAAQIEAVRVPFAAAVEALRPMEAAVTVAEAGYRAAVRSGTVRLGSFKRDLKSLGLTESQIHEIIPDAGAGSKRKKGKGEEGEEGGGGGSGGGDPPK